MSVLPSEPFEPLGDYYIVLPVSIDGAVREVKISVHNSRRLLRADHLLQMLEEAAEESKNLNTRALLNIDKTLVEGMFEALAPKGRG